MRHSRHVSLQFTFHSLRNLLLAQPKRPCDANTPSAVIRRMSISSWYDALLLRSLACSYRQLSKEVRDLEAELDRLTRTAAPALVGIFGIGPDSAASLLIAAGSNSERLQSEAAFASLCSVSPKPASSGKTYRHRRNRGGDRQANAALYRIDVVRLRLDRRTTEGMSKDEVIRCLKRYVAREVFSALQDSVEIITRAA